MPVQIAISFGFQQRRKTTYVDRVHAHARPRTHAHTRIIDAQVDFTFVKIDSWDSGEKVSFQIDYDSYWSESLHTYTSGTHVCGQTDTAKSNWWQEVYFEKTFVVVVSPSSLLLSP